LKTAKRDQKKTNKWANGYILPLRKSKKLEWKEERGALLKEDTESKKKAERKGEERKNYQVILGNTSGVLT